VEAEGGEEEEEVIVVVIVDDAGPIGASPATARTGVGGRDGRVSENSDRAGDGGVSRLVAAAILVVSACC